MGVPTQHIALDVKRTPVAYGSTRSIYLGEGDHNGTVLVVDVTEGGEPFDCSAYTPYLMMPVDGRLYRQEGTSDNDTVAFNIDESRLGNFKGKIGDAYVSLEDSDGDVVTSTQRFTVIVSGAAESDVDTDAYVSELDELYARAGELLASFGDAEYGSLTERDIDDIFAADASDVESGGDMDDVFGV